MNSCHTPWDEERLKRNGSVLFASALAMVCLSGFPRTHAQTQSPPAFEVASIKLNANCAGQSPRGNVVPGRVSLPCMSLRALIRTAYSDVMGRSRRLQVLDGPAWLDSDRYDISAIADNGASVDLMMGLMLQRLLKERFGLETHREFGESPVYELTVGTSKPLRLQASRDGSCTPMEPNSLTGPLPTPGQPLSKTCGIGSGRRDADRIVTEWYGVTMAEFAARMLPIYVDRQVIDKTGLITRFDIHLTFVPDMLQSGLTRLNGAVNPDERVPTSAASGPSIFTALEELGLKLSPARVPIEVIVVDHAEKPTAN